MLRPALLAILSILLAAVGPRLAQGAAPAAPPLGASAAFGAELCPLASPAFVQASRPISPKTCTAQTTCLDGSTQSCTGTTGQTCTDDLQSCTTPDGCSGTQAYVLCGTVKKTCSCVKLHPDCGVPCPDPDCPDGASCTSDADCEPCGSCFRNLCACKL